MKQYLPVLKKSSFFGGLSEEEILTALGCIGGRVISKEQNEYIAHAGDSTTDMGLVLEGDVLIIQEDVWGHRNIMANCGQGDFFGEPYAATPGAVLNISVVARRDCKILLMDVKRVLTVCPHSCAHHQRLVQNLVVVLSKKILSFNDKITHMSKRTTREKILSYLSAQSMRENSLCFDIPYDRQQLADFLCVERSAMSVELSKLQKEGILKTNRKHFELFL